MRLYLNRAEYSYEMENVCRLFFPHEKFEKYYDNYSDDYDITCIFSVDNDQTVVTVHLYFGDNDSCF